MDKQIRKILAEAEDLLESANSQEELEKLYIKLFGKNSDLNKLTKKISTLDPVYRPKAGQSINKAKNHLEKIYKDTQSRIRALKGQQAKELIDITAPGEKTKIGHLHLVSQAIGEIVEIFAKLGYGFQNNSPND